MPGSIDSRKQIDDDDIISIINIDRFRPSLKCDLFIPSYVHSLSVATEFVYDYVLSRFPSDYFKTIHISGKHPYEDFRRLQKGEMQIRENPAMAISYTIQYDYNDNNIDLNLLSTNKYLKKSQWQRSFFKCPHKGLYLGMDLEAMMINYNFKFRVNTKSQQLDLFNRMRKVFRLGCTETVDIDCDFHLDNDLIIEMAKESGFAVDSVNNTVVNPWNFTKFMNQYSQMPILYKLREINQRYEYFLRMRNLPVHLDFQNNLDVDDGNQSGMIQNNFGIEFQIELRFPAPRTFQLYNEGHNKQLIKIEDDDAVKVFSMKVFDIPEENYKHWPIYSHSNYLADESETSVEKIDISELFKAPVDIKVGTSLDDLIQDAIDQFIDPNIFIEVAVYTNELSIDNESGRLAIEMDWLNRTIKLAENTPNTYFYIAIYIDRGYINNKVIEKTNAQNNRVSLSNQSKSLEDDIRNNYVQDHTIEETKTQVTSILKQCGKARFIVNK